MNHLEQLLCEYYDWQGYVVKSNIMVGRRDKGGWDMELDVMAYHHKTNKLIHLEPSTDAHSWAEREKRFTKKFKFGREHILKNVFPWLDLDIEIEQIAILPTNPKDRETVGGGKIISIDEFVREIKDKIIAEGKMNKNAIPQKYPLLRTIQLTQCGYASLK